jgi:hypothetical protein
MRKEQIACGLAKIVHVNLRTRTAQVAHLRIIDSVPNFRSTQLPCEHSERAHANQPASGINLGRGRDGPLIGRCLVRAQVG